MKSKRIFADFAENKSTGLTIGFTLIEPPNPDIRLLTLSDLHQAAQVLSQERGVSEAELIRQAIEREASNIPALAASPDRSAWQELVAFLDARQKTMATGQAYRWNREEIYAERENRWVRDRDEN